MSSPESHHVQVDIETSGDTVVAAVSGEIDAATADEFEARLRSAVATTTSVSLALADVTFMDSSGLRALMTINGEVVARGGSIELRSTSTMVDRLLSVTGLEPQFTRPA